MAGPGAMYLKLGPEIILCLCPLRAQNKDGNHGSNAILPANSVP